MNLIFKRLCAAILLLSGTAHASNNVFGKTFFNPRSQGSNLARWMAGQGHHTHLCDTDCVNGSLAITSHYFQSFNEKEIGEYFFFNKTNTMRFGPADTPGVDVFARNFFLNISLSHGISPFLRSTYTRLAVLRYDMLHRCNSEI